MKKTAHIVTLLALVSLLKAADMKIPDVSKPGEGAVLSAGLIYPLDDKPTPQCHATTIEEIDSGLVAAWFGGSHEKNDDVGIWFAGLNEGSWSTPVQLVDGSEGEEKDYPCWNPVHSLAPCKECRHRLRSPPERRDSSGL